MDELDAWVIYGRIADAALAIESLVYTPPFGDMAGDMGNGGKVCRHHEILFLNCSANHPFHSSTLTWYHVHQAKQTQSVVIIDPTRPTLLDTFSIYHVIP